MFEGTNYKDGPYAVGKFWAVKFVLRLRDPKRASWWTDTIESVEEFRQDFAKLAKTSPLMEKLLEVTPLPYAVRHLTGIKRERERFEVGDWVLIEQGGVRVICRIRAMAECLMEGGHLGASSVVRLWCDSIVEGALGARGELWAPKPGPQSGETLVKLEEVHVTSLTRNQYASHDTYL